MAGILMDLPVGGFSFDNCLRNDHLVEKGFSAPKARKTGTTIVGIIYEDGVILGADTRATCDKTVADKNSSKVHYLAPNIYCCGAGTAADTEMTTRLISSQLEMHSLNTGRQSRVCTANCYLTQHLFKYQGHIGAALILGGVDITGPSLYSIYPHGSADFLPYVTMGSGSLAAMAVFEQRWKPKLTLEEGKVLVRNAIAAGIFNDLFSGSNIDMCVITKDGAKHIRPYEIASKKGQRHGSYKYRRGATAVLSSVTVPFEVEVTVTKEIEMMDTST